MQAMRRLCTALLVLLAAGCGGSAATSSSGGPAPQDVSLQLDWYPNPDHVVSSVNVGFNLVPALLGGKVDAIAGAFQNIEGAQLRARGVDPVVFPVDRYGVPTYDELVLVANRDRLSSDEAYRRRTRA